jgi:hypothetical protein
MIEFVIGYLFAGIVFTTLSLFSFNFQETKDECWSYFPLTDYSQTSFALIFVCVYFLVITITWPVILFNFLTGKLKWHNPK